ncbi:MAG: hypothetical protein WBX22_30315 [Silvibacterium sp.]
MGPRSAILPYSLHMLRPSLGNLTWIFLRYANFTFDGGTATTVVIDQQIVDRETLLDRDTARLSYALARLTPGTVSSLRAGRNLRLPRSIGCSGLLFSDVVDFPLQSELIQARKGKTEK